ncbi:hypothetical protein M752DRAFT_128925 [Aspergillus phoenicis ATCC 13157]|uniref:Uncharacterized protein n=1 Tax=Aspergillus phoenicis ATCC 13157 TaxID=1353007 RepID=A0A370PRS0_ASPPH|nr:hypothetical protein M752DRAFT_128925 [Aspergillus phoenicis ATCC 13157]
MMVLHESCSDPSLPFFFSFLFLFLSFFHPLFCLFFFLLLKFLYFLLFCFLSFPGEA